MITREEAIERALDYLTGGLRQRVKAFEGWPGEAEQHDSAGVPRPLRFPDYLRNPDAPKQTEPDAPCDEPTIGMRQRVWRVHVPGDGRHVGADHFIIVELSRAVWSGQCIGASKCSRAELRQLAEPAGPAPQVILRVVPVAHQHLARSRHFACRTFLRSQQQAP